MRPRLSSEVVDQDRRQLLTAAATVAAAVGSVNLLPTKALAANDAEAIRPFTINVPQDQLPDMRRRIAATRWPEQGNGCR